MLNVDMLACFCSAWLLGYFCCWLWRRNRNTKEGTPSASHNTGSRAIVTLLERYKSEELSPSDNTQLLDWFVTWCQQQA